MDISNDAPALVVTELMNENFWLEKHRQELTPQEFENLRRMFPSQRWVIFAKLRKENVTNPSFDWDGYLAYQHEHEKWLKSEKQTLNNKK